MEHTKVKLFDKIKIFGPVAYKISLHHRKKEPKIYMSYGPPGWIDHYDHNAYVFMDPSLMYAFSNEGVCRFDTLDYPDPSGVLTRAKRFGLKYGIVAAVGPVHSKSFCTVCRADRPYDGDEMLDVLRSLTVLHHLYKARNARLTKTEREALRVISSGLNYEAAALEMGISFSAVKARLSKARIKLGVKTTLEAVHQAQRTGIL